MDEMNRERQRQEDTTEIALVQLALDFFRIAKKRWWLFAGLLAVGTAIAFGVSFIQYTPLYRCEATFTVSTGENTGFYYSTTAADQMSRTFPYILDSSYFRSVLLDTLETDTLNGEISAETIENSNMVTMTVSSPSPEDARSILEAALSVYPEVSRFVLGDIELNLIDEIQTPTSPYNVPSKKRLLAYGAFGGLLVASILTLVWALLNNTVKSAEAMERFTSLECLGALPAVKQKARKNSAVSQYVSILDHRTPHGFRESVSALAVRVRSALKEKGGNILLITSSMAGEGKSTVAIDLAEQLAREKHRVMLIDFDLRGQNDARLLGMKGGVTVADVLRKPKLLDDNFLRFSKRLGFFFWGGEQREQNPSPYLRDPHLKDILQRLCSQVDYLILDTPPCGIFPDASILAEYADASLLVVRYDAVTGPGIMESLSMLNDAQVPVLGYVFNAFPQTSGSYGYGYGRYGYGRYGYGRYGYSNYGYGESEKEENGAQHLESRGASG